MRLKTWEAGGGCGRIALDQHCAKVLEHHNALLDLAVKVKAPSSWRTFQGLVKSHVSLRCLNHNMKKSNHKSKDKLEFGKPNASFYPSLLSLFCCFSTPFPYRKEEKEDFFIQSLKKDPW